MTRRQAVKWLLGGTASLACAPSLALARAPAPLRHASGTLSCYNTHTDEFLTARYLTPEGAFDPQGVGRLEHLFRCHYTGEVHPIAPELFVLLDATRVRLGAAERPIQLVSGFRSPAYNRVLRSRSRNVAKKSFHLQGMAADVRIDGVKVADLREAALGFRAGGVGRYAEFVHLDVGPVRTW